MSPTTTKTFTQLMEEVRNGSQDAAWELVEEYGPHVQRFVRRTLIRELRSKFDSLDFVQIVWASMFREPDRFVRFQSPDELIAFLAGVARNKVLTEMRRRTQSARYDVGRENEISGGGDPCLAAHMPTPSAVAVAKERWTSLLSRQNSTVQSVVSLRLRGESYLNIADQLQIHERTVRKCLAQLTGDHELQP